MYPDVDNNPIYPFLGLNGETGELLQKILLSPYDIESIKKEMGDILWYCSAICSEFCVSLEILEQQSENFMLTNNLKLEEQLVIESSIVSEIVKKVLRDSEDGIFDKKSKDKIIEHLIVILYCLDGIAEYYDTNIEEIASGNISKLFDRKKRNVIGGSGDNR